MVVRPSQFHQRPWHHRAVPKRSRNTEEFQKETGGRRLRRPPGTKGNGLPRVSDGDTKRKRFFLFTSQSCFPRLSFHSIGIRGNSCRSTPSERSRALSLAAAGTLRSNDRTLLHIACRDNCTSPDRELWKPSRVRAESDQQKGMGVASGAHATMLVVLLPLNASAIRAD